VGLLPSKEWKQGGPPRALDPVTRLILRYRPRFMLGTPLQRHGHGRYCEPWLLVEPATAKSVDGNKRSHEVFCREQIHAPFNAKKIRDDWGVCQLKAMADCNCMSARPEPPRASAQIARLSESRKTGERPSFSLAEMKYNEEK